ncbi:PREDICTED: transmembrane protein 177 [Nanorana parkeri]|uniref:transmembrane protein 177 n=1 Tax=Nanorana parkeri TaxID=125878 RepID=UPI000854A8BD|nr:PREDICTED: transmembrane protein 177 [Nanorana parkeri]
MAFRLFMKFCTFTRIHRGKLLGASSLALFAAKMSYHALPELTFRKLYQGWFRGEPAELSDKLHALFREVLEEARCTSSSGYTPFAVYGFHPISAGVPWLPGGCLIGIPPNYNGAEDGAGIVNRVLVVEGEEVDWSGDVGRKLRDSLTFSLDAQKFSLAREAVQAQDSGPVIQAFVAPACFASVCVSSVGLKQLLGLYSGPVLLRGVFNMLAVALGFTGYVLCSDAVSHWLDYRADRKVAALSGGYARGGLEFYDKILARNQILRGIMGEKGKAMYAPSGNLYPRHKLRLKHAPYTCRRDRIQRALQAMRS